MTKLVMREQGHRRGAKTVSLNVEKSPNHESAVVTDDSGRELISFEIEAGTQRLIVGVTDSGAVSVQDGVTKAPIVTKVTKSVQDADSSRNWKIEDGVMSVWLANGNAIELDVMDEPGPYTPAESVHEVLGQPNLIFAVALGIKLGKHTLLSGPTGIAKTTAYRWMAKMLNYNFILQPIARGTESSHMVGEYLPVDEAGKFEWTDGPTTTAVRLSQDHPTILVYDEINRIGNIAEFARLYQLLDDTRTLELKEKRSGGMVETLKAGQLYVGATSNPSDDEHADYVGVQDLDPALNSRFGLQPPLAYPDPTIEAKALADRVPNLNAREAEAMVGTAQRIRQASNVRFPISFRELEAWALALPFFGWKQAAEIAVISKAAKMYQPDLRKLIQLQTKPGVSTNS